jgi:hypothetical protein
MYVQPSQDPDSLTHQHLRGPRKRVAVKREDTAETKVTSQDLAIKKTPPTTQTRSQQADVKIKPEQISDADTIQDDKKSIIPANRIKQEKRKSGQISAACEVSTESASKILVRKRRSDQMAVGPTNVKSPANEIPIKKEQILPPSTIDNQTGKTKRQRIIEMPEQISHEQSHDKTVHEDTRYEANLNAARRGKARVELPLNNEDSGDEYEDSEVYRQSLILKLEGLQAREAIQEVKELQTLVDFTHPTMQEV